MPNIPFAFMPLNNAALTSCTIHPNETNRPRAIPPNEMRRGGACVPARTSAQRRFHTQMNEYNYTTHRGAEMHRALPPPFFKTNYVCKLASR